MNFTLMARRLKTAFKTTDSGFLLIRHQSTRFLTTGSGFFLMRTIPGGRGRKIAPGGVVGPGGIPFMLLSVLRLLLLTFRPKQWPQGRFQILLLGRPWTLGEGGA